MQALLPTRRFFNTLVDDHHLVVSENCTSIMHILQSDVLAFESYLQETFSYGIELRLYYPPPPPPQISPLSLINPPFQGKKVNKPPPSLLSPPLLLFTNKKIDCINQLQCTTVKLRVD